MKSFVSLAAKRSRGWPWPEESSGRGPMYGKDGWCHSCGMPCHEQTGSLVLQRRNMTVTGAWLPYWKGDVICMEASLASELSSKFDLAFRSVEWPKSENSDAVQLVIPVVGEKWYNPDQLARVTTARHGETGAKCAECGRWRWMPLAYGSPRGTLPPLVDPLLVEDVNVAASPEWFGSGWMCFRQLLFRRELAEAICAASPRDFEMVEVE